jgi:hypothetical protein
MAAVILAAGAVGFVYFLYQKGKASLEKDGRYGEYAPGQDGNDPDWVKGKQLLGDGPPDTHDTFRPSCQVWDEVDQLFVNGGNKAADADLTGATCFGLPNQAFPNRYVNDKGAVSFAGDVADSILGGNPGHCYFWAGSGFELKPAEAIVNRSDRLCFGAGGHHFIANNGQYTANPAVSYLPGENEGGTGVMADYVPVITPSYCEGLTQTVGSAGVMASLWGHTNVSSKGDGDVDKCLSLAKTSGVTEFRFRPDAKTAVYRNRYTGHDIMTTLDAPITI